MKISEIKLGESYAYAAYWPSHMSLSIADVVRFHAVDVVEVTRPHYAGGRVERRVLGVAYYGNGTTEGLTVPPRTLRATWAEAEAERAKQAEFTKKRVAASWEQASRDNALLQALGFTERVEARKNGYLVKPKFTVDDLRGLAERFNLPISVSRGE